MKKLILLLLLGMLSITRYGQTEIEAKDLTKKELRELKKQKALKNKKTVMPKEA